MASGGGNQAREIVERLADLSVEIADVSRLLAGDAGRAPTISTGWSECPGSSVARAKHGGIGPNRRE